MDSSLTMLLIRLLMGEIVLFVNYLALVKLSESLSSNYCFKRYIDAGSLFDKLL